MTWAGRLVRFSPSKRTEPARIFSSPDSPRRIAVGADQADDPPSADGEIDALDDEALAIADLEAARFEQRGGHEAAPRNSPAPLTPR
jgi:hypothetical protein